MNHDANRAVSLVDLVVTAVVGAIGEEFTKIRADHAALRLEIDRLKARAAAAEPDRVESDPDGTLAIVYRRANGTEQRLRLWRPGGWVGVWDIETSYAVNDTVTHDGSLWLAVCSSKGERPGSSSTDGTRTAWRLIVKHGKDSARRGRP